ncbi:FecCD family ABC transporter permease [Motilibacter deserti]|nr:iron chelate uptake ABC transporter family permease subunit [Motilibacter deserti]
MSRTEPMAIASPGVGGDDGSGSTATRAAGPVPRGGPWARTGGLVLALVLLAAVSLLSIAVGSRALSLGTVLDVLLHPDDSTASTVVHDLRVPRTLIGLAVGAALGLAGALMQAVTRNPLADPGILGVNAGAAAAAAVAISIFGFTDPAQYVWPALAGAAVTSVVVYGLGATGRSGATPIRLALAGTAVSAALGAFTQALSLSDPGTFDAMRFWQVGALSGHDMSTLTQVGPFLALGAVIALALARSLNALALGEDTGRALGAHVGRTRAWSALAILLLCGAATAAVGPIAFVGLTVPHVARAFVGPDQRWVLPWSMVLAPVLLLTADVIGRVVARPGELQAAFITALIGAPVFVAVVRRRKVAQL